MRNSKLSRREMITNGGLILLGAASAGMLTNCGQSGLASGIGATGSTASGSDGLCSIIPSETEGPYPAHDDSAKNCLRFAGIVRSDIKSSLGVTGYTGTAVATGVPLTLTLNLVSASNCSPLSGYAIYIWHCDVNGMYSMYSSSIANQTYLRGVQSTDSNGQVTFQTIIPGCYDGRMPHMHFEIYPSLNQAVDDYYATRTSQLTFPLATLNEVYNNVAAYSSSKTNLTRVSFASDMVFSDGYATQMVSIASGNSTSGYVASLNVGI